ncbi:MAG: hypothetical protein BroJett025_04580 [Patescibacteria group bacterium]|nr:MAG: hypothetical protein BroJett025_04580 [Patescibacteria group bacterium]
MEKKAKPHNWLKFFDDNILLILSTFLLIFIPLYPKLPLFDLIEGYIVRVRLEDFLIAFCILIYGVQLLRKKISLDTPLTKIIFAYIVVGFLSTISGIFITQTIPTTQVHLLKSFLHFGRYIEYFSLFFLLYASIKSKRDVQIILVSVVFTLLAVGIYGLGQKYFYWPVYSTMNREFSKGIVLYLTEHARVQSTFAGHYDMAAYLVIVLPIILVMLFQKKINLFPRMVLWTTYILGLLMMMLSASRTSLAGLVLGLFLTILIASLLKERLISKVQFFFQQSFVSGLIFVILFVFFGSNMADRLYQVIENRPEITTVLTGIKNTSNMILSQFKVQEYIAETVKKPENGLSTEQAEVLVASDTRPSPIKPSDVYVDVPDKIQVATVSATGQKTFVTLEVPRTYSENALKHGLSMAIRLDTLWPQALNGFYKNPALGTGYATLTKSVVEEFTEADSTDNNFLRTLGETGLLGFLSFYGCVFIALATCKNIIKNRLETDSFKKLFAVGFIGATIGLLINAAFIDVFAASKVAYTYWAMTGVLLAYAKLKPIEKTIKVKPKKRIRTNKNKFSNT